MLKVISLLLAFSVFFLVFGNGLQEGFKGIDITTKDDYELANVFRGDEFMTEFDYQKDGSVHEGYTTNYLDKKNPIQSIVGLNGNRFIVRADQESGGEGSVSLSSKKRWKSGLFVFSVNHVPQGRGVTGSIVFQDYDGSKLCGKQNVVAGPTHSARDAILGLSPINKIKWCGKSLMANSLNSSRGCSTYIWVFQLSPDKRSVDFWIFPISQAPLDLLNEKPVPSQWLQKPCTIQLTKCASPINGKPNTETSATLVAEAEGGDSYDVAEPTTLHREILDDNVEESDHYVNSVDPHFSVGIQLVYQKYYIYDKKSDSYSERSAENLDCSERFDDCNDSQDAHHAQTRPDPGAYWEINYLKVYQLKENSEQYLSTANSQEANPEWKNISGFCIDMPRLPDVEVVKNPSALDSLNEQLEKLKSTLTPINGQFSSGCSGTNDLTTQTIKAVADLQEKLDSLLNVKTCGGNNALSNLTLSSIDLDALLNKYGTKEGTTKLMDAFPKLDPSDLTFFLNSLKVNRRDMDDVANVVSQCQKSRRLFGSDDSKQETIETQSHNVPATVVEEDTSKSPRRLDYVTPRDATPVVMAAPLLYNAPVTLPQAVMPSLYAAPAFPAVRLSNLALSAVGHRVEEGKNLIGLARMKGAKSRDEMQQLIEADLHTKAQNVRNTAADLLTTPIIRVASDFSSPDYYINRQGPVESAMRSYDGDVAYQGTARYFDQDVYANGNGIVARNNLPNVNYYDEAVLFRPSTVGTLLGRIGAERAGIVEVGRRNVGMAGDTLVDWVRKGVVETEVERLNNLNARGYTPVDYYTNGNNAMLRNVNTGSGSLINFAGVNGNDDASIPLDFGGLGEITSVGRDVIMVDGSNNMGPMNETQASVSTNMNVGSATNVHAASISDQMRESSNINLNVPRNFLGTEEIEGMNDAKRRGMKFTA